MSALGQRTLVMLLSDTDSLEVLVKEGLNPEVIPSAALRPIVGWALTYYRASGLAPTPAVLNEHFADTLADNEIDPAGDVEESIEWAIDDLRGSFVRNEAGKWAREFVTSVTEADNTSRVDVLAEFSSRLAGTVLSLQSNTAHVDMRHSGEGMLARYDAAVANRGQVIGMSLGVPQLDQYTGGIHDGELAVLGGPAKSTKSFFLDYVALKTWERGRVAGLYTLENSIEMTEMRIACQALHIDVTELQSGHLSDEDLDALKTWVHDVLQPSSTPLHIMSPATVQRTPHAIVASAKAFGVDDLIVDQLTFMEDGSGKQQQSRTYEVRSMLHDLKGLISTGRGQLPCLLAHQIKRDVEAHKTGRLKMSDFAESSEVERTADWGFSLWQDDDARVTGRMLWQTLAARRAPIVDFDMGWDIVHGLVSARNDVAIP